MPITRVWGAPYCAHHSSAVCRQMSYVIVFKVPLQPHTTVTSVVCPSHSGLSGKAQRNCQPLFVHTHSFALTRAVSNRPSKKGMQNKVTIDTSMCADVCWCAVVYVSLPHSIVVSYCTSLYCCPYALETLGVGAFNEGIDWSLRPDDESCQPALIEIQPAITPRSPGSIYLLFCTSSRHRSSTPKNTIMWC